jgi:hypothetical protein
MEGFTNLLICIFYGAVSALHSLFPHFRLRDLPLCGDRLVILALEQVKKQIVEVSAKFTQLQWNKF